MVALHTVYVVSLVSQATSTLALALLAWRDRQARGLNFLAVACGLHAVAVFLMPLWRGTDRWVPQALSAALMPLMFWWMYRGMAILVGRREEHKTAWRCFVALAIVLGCAFAHRHRLWSIQVMQVTALVLLCASIRMLWPTERGPLRMPARATAVVLGALAVMFALRLWMEPFYPTSSLFLLLREVTIAGITLLAFAFLGLYLGQSQQRLYLETRRDVLTGLPNRRAIEEIASQQVSLAWRRGGPLALLMIDLDRFKLLNDTWGHGMGDRALRAVGSVLQIAADQGDNEVARLGGEEFAMLLPDHTASAAEGVAERLRAAIEGLTLAEGGLNVRFTASLGVAAWHHGETTWTEMLRRADTALYRAKHEGRNRVVVCEDAASVDRGGERTSTRRALRPRRRLRSGRTASAPTHVASWADETDR